MELKEFLEDHGIEYWTSGKNVVNGWINIQCIFCDDDSNHLGVHRKSLKVSCWRCGNHNIINLIKELSGTTYNEAISIKKSLSLGATDYGFGPPYAEDDASSLLSAHVRLPQESRKYFPEKHIEYLRYRGFTDPEKIIRKYKLRSVYTTGKYKFRIIIPIMLNKKIVSFTSRDITGLQDPKYKHASPEESAIDVKRIIYNYDTVTTGSDAILVEGPIDVWKLGDKTISLLGIHHTEEQILSIKNKKIRNLFILFDNDKAGVAGAKRMAGIISPLVKSVEIVTFNTIKDPGELKEEEAEILKRELGIVV